MKITHSGFVWLPILLAVLGVLIVSGSAYAYLQTRHTPASINLSNFMPVASSTPQTSDSSYRTINKVFAIDGEHAYVYGAIGKGTPVIIDGADVKTFISTGDYTAKDANHSYGLDAKGYLAIDGVSEQPAEDNTVAPPSQSISVPGMSQYTDSSFGFSFWYPSGWTVTEVAVASPDDNGWYQGGSVVKRFSVHGAEISDGVTIDEFRSSGLSVTELGATKSASPVGVDRKYYFDPSSHAWMYTNLATSGGDGDPNFLATFVADVSNNTMGGLHIFPGMQRFGNDDIVPLSAQNFVVVSSNDTGSNFHQYVEKTITATDPSVATPVSAAQQTATIQAELNAYAGQ